MVSRFHLRHWTIVALSPGISAAAHYRAKLQKKSWTHPEVEKWCFMTVKNTVFSSIVSVPESTTAQDTLAPRGETKQAVQAV